MKRIFVSTLLVIVGTFSLLGFAQAETTECTVIDSLPYTISAQGIYCLKGDLSYNLPSGYPITINNDNVTIDFNGYMLDNLAAGDSNNASGIFAQQRHNITIKNGTIRGFYRAIFLNDIPGTRPYYRTSQGHIIEDMRIDQGTFEGIHVKGRGNIIRNNQVVDSGGSTLSGNVFGIVVHGLGNRVLNNDVFDTIEGTSAFSYGIILYNADGSVVRGNRVGNTELGLGTSTGILFNIAQVVMTIDNTLTNLDIGINYAGANGKYRDNLTNNCVTPFSGGGTDAGNNN